MQFPRETGAKRRFLCGCRIPRRDDKMWDLSFCESMLHLRKWLLLRVPAPFLQSDHHGRGKNSFGQKAHLELLHRLTVLGLLAPLLLTQEATRPSSDNDQARGLRLNSVLGWDDVFRGVFSPSSCEQLITLSSREPVLLCPVGPLVDPFLLPGYTAPED